MVVLKLPVSVVGHGMSDDSSRSMPGFESIALLLSRTSSRSLARLQFSGCRLQVHCSHACTATLHRRFDSLFKLVFASLALLALVLALLHEK